MSGETVGAHPAGRPELVFSQGDPAGIGPEILLGLVDDWVRGRRDLYRPVLVAERAALEALRTSLPDAPWGFLAYVSPADLDRELAAGPDLVPVVDPVSQPRLVELGRPGREDAEAAIRCLDTAFSLVQEGDSRARRRALVTAPLGKEVIARFVDPAFRGHTGHLAARCHRAEYGREHLMAFLTSELRVALLSTHCSLREAIDGVTRESLLDAIQCLSHSIEGTSLEGKIAVAGLNPHAGEGGLLGSEETEVIEPAVREARRLGFRVDGPFSPDTIFRRALDGEFCWVLALYHDQGLIAVKTKGFGDATNVTLGLPVVRTSVDHGTAYEIAGQGRARVEPLLRVVATTLELLAQGS